MIRGEGEFACGFCHKAFRSLKGKLRHLKVCKGLLPDDRRHLPGPAGRDDAREHHRHQ